MVAPADPVHKAAREQTVLALELVLDELLMGIAGAVLEANEKLRVWAGMPPKVDADLEASRKTKAPPRVDTRLADDTGAAQGEYEPSAARRGRGKAPAPPAAAAPAPVAAEPAPKPAPAKRAAPEPEPDGDEVPAGVPVRAQGVYRKAYALGAGGEKAENPYDLQSAGAGAWLGRSWALGYENGRASRKGV